MRCWKTSKLMSNKEHMLMPPYDSVLQTHLVTLPEVSTRPSSHRRKSRIGRKPMKLKAWSSCTRRTNMIGTVRI